MVSDEELKQHVKRVEQEQAMAPEVAHRIDELESTARCVHNELARRIESTAADSADADSLVALESRIEAMERRLERLEASLD
jgi:hypothetical protein